MTDGKSQPTAGVRVRARARSVDELQSEFAPYVSRTTITLEGTGARTAGDVLRFEVLLADNTPALRGEGRVVGVQGSGARAGVVLRFTKLDSRTKQLVDAMAALHAASQSQPRFADPPSASGPVSVGSLRSQPASHDAGGGPGSSPSSQSKAGASTPALAALWRDALDEGDDDEFALPRAEYPAPVMPPAPRSMPPAPGALGLGQTPERPARDPSQPPGLAPRSPDAPPIALQPLPPLASQRPAPARATAQKSSALARAERAAVEADLETLTREFGSKLPGAVTRARALAGAHTARAELFAQLEALARDARLSVKTFAKEPVSGTRSVRPVSIAPPPMPSMLPPSLSDFEDLPAILGMFGGDDPTSEPRDASQPAPMRDVWTATGGVPAPLRNARAAANAPLTARPMESLPPVFAPRADEPKACSPEEVERSMREPTPVPSVPPDRVSFRPSAAPLTIDAAGAVRVPAGPKVPKDLAATLIDDPWRTKMAEPSAVEPAEGEQLEAFDGAPLAVAGREEEG